MRIEIVGTGISGLGAACSLAPKHDVAVFERERQTGGHTHTHRVNGPGRPVARDRARRPPRHTGRKDVRRRDLA
ncbi:MAG: NAD(P)-binding protein [Gemmatimonadota bacterium]|nr:NAD(P)-binding protein [Gemmatimonadota bacterium]